MQRTADVGVIVGRFQTNTLHKGHQHLIQTVCDQHEKVIIFLGLSPLPATKNNPLDFQSRQQMILKAFPDVIVCYIADMASDEKWSNKLDKQITQVTTPAQSVLLYGSRDSFISHYSGRHKTHELESDHVFSGTAERRLIAAGNTKATPDFRHGAIWSTQSRYPTVYTTVDVAIFNDDYTKLLLARKPDEDNYRFVGGFADVASPNFEADARREVQEETGLPISDPQYICSMRVDDWRYRSEQDKITTIFFAAKSLWGTPKPDDDIEEVVWIDLDDDAVRIVNEHKPLMEALRTWMAEKEIQNV